MLDISLPGNSHKSTFETSIPGVLLLREREPIHVLYSVFLNSPGHGGDEIGLLYLLAY